MALGEKKPSKHFNSHWLPNIPSAVTQKTLSFAVFNGHKCQITNTNTLILHLTANTGRLHCQNQSAAVVREIISVYCERRRENCVLHRHCVDKARRFWLLRQMARTETKVFKRDQISTYKFRFPGLVFLKQVWDCVLLYSVEMIIILISCHFKAGKISSVFFVSWRNPPPVARTSSLSRLHVHAQTHHTR